MTHEQPEQHEPQERPPRRPGKRELDAVFGEVLPDTTSDERDPGSRRRDSDDWHLENRPPHHDR